ncbi:unnamed protein product [Caenorhabditis angaria]|uniref:Uncharacterized protein n=1 Tax=Caenorhabditis angaria TaxID=860376 RepID=A0A9P1MZ15_9PELO|nr:unnamed protein product [Caenorhabditis angaria]
MPKQEFTDFDLLAGPICFVFFLIGILAMSVCCFNYCYILKDDELTTLEIWAYKRKLNWRLGPHSRKTIENKMAERRFLEDK